MPDPLQYDAVFAQNAARRQEAMGNKEFAQAGGLIGYGANREAIFRRATVLADKLLRGARPADIPVEQPSAFELLLNARAARGIGLALPPRLRLQADEVIE